MHAVRAWKSVPLWKLKIKGYDCIWIAAFPENWECGKQWTEMIISWEGGRRFTFLDLTSVGREIVWSIWTFNQIFFPSLMKALLLKMGKLFVPGTKWEGIAPSAVSKHLYAQVCSQQNQCGLCCYESSSKECCSSAQLWAWLPLTKQWYRNQEGFTFFSSTYTRENGNDILFFALLLTLICFNFSILLSSLIASSFLLNKTLFLSQSSQFSVSIAGLKLLQVSAWITRRQKTSQVSWPFTVRLISSPLTSKTH